VKTKTKTETKTWLHWNILKIRERLENGRRKRFPRKDVYYYDRQLLCLIISETFLHEYRELLSKEQLRLAYQRGGAILVVFGFRLQDKVVARSVGVGNDAIFPSEQYETLKPPAIQYSWLLVLVSKKHISKFWLMLFVPSKKHPDGQTITTKETTSFIALSPTVRKYHLGVRICTERKHTSRSARSHREGDSKSHTRASCQVTRFSTRAPVSCCVLLFSSWKERAQRGFYFMCVKSLLSSIDLCWNERAQLNLTNIVQFRQRFCILCAFAPT